MAKSLRNLGTPLDEEGNEAIKEPVRTVLKEVVAPEFEASRLHNGQLEFLSIVQNVLDPELRARLWPRYSEDHFAADVSNAIYKRLQMLAAGGWDWPKLATLATDPALPPAAQVQLASVVSKFERTGAATTSGHITLANGSTVEIRSSTDFETLVFDVLEAYRITRQAAGAMVSSIQALADDQEFDPLKGPSLVEKVAVDILALRGREAVGDSLMHFGYGITEDDRERREQEMRKLFAADKPRFKTGFHIFDEKAGGFQPGEVILLGANTGAGKSALQLSFMKNMARTGTSVAMLQLELTLGQVNERLASNLGRIDSELVRTGRLTDKDHETIRQAYEDFDDELRAAQSRMTFFAPSSATIQECEYVFKSFDYKVWFIDYINLINWQGIGKDQDWLKLSEIVKEFKRIAKKYGIAVVLAVQVNIDKDSGEIEIRYSKAMKEHADVVLVWHMTEDAREEGVVWLRHLKARQYEPFDFPIRIALNFCGFENYLPGSQPVIEKRKLGGNRRQRLVDDEPPKAPRVQEPQTFARKERPLVEDAELPVPSRKTALTLPDDDDNYKELDDDADRED